MITIGIIGYGYWGPNILRNFSQLPSVRISRVCDIDPQAVSRIKLHYPSISVTTDINDIINDSSCDAVVIVTPISTHFTLARLALLAGKHVLVEKPITTTTKEAATLVTIAEKHKRILMVDHTFLYTPAVHEMIRIVSNGALGEILHIDCVRTNLGLLQKDSNVIYDLATHDLSIIDQMIHTLPQSVSASGISLAHTTQESIAYIHAGYPNGLHVHFQVSWLSPVKVRRMTVIGTKKMLVYDDMEPTEKIKIYDKSISLINDPKKQQQLRIGYRIGSTVAPHIDVKEGLAGMANAFIHAIETGTPPVSDGKQGRRIVSVLEAATRSARKGGTIIPIRAKKMHT